MMLKLFMKELKTRLGHEFFFRKLYKVFPNLLLFVNIIWLV